MTETRIIPPGVIVVSSLTELFRASFDNRHNVILLPADAQADPESPQSEVFGLPVACVALQLSSPYWLVATA